MTASTLTPITTLGPSQPQPGYNPGDDFEHLGHHIAQLDIDVLRGLAAEVNAELIIEVGSFVGQTASALATTGRRVLCVDTFTGTDNDPAKYDQQQILATFCRNMEPRGLLFGVFPLWGPSHVWAQCLPEQRADLIFIDAAHDFKSVCQDGVNWWKHLRPGGIMAFHDYSVRPGVDQALQWLFGNPDGELGVLDIQVGHAWDPQANMLRFSHVAFVQKPNG